MFSDIDIKKCIGPLYAQKIICMDGKTKVIHRDTDEMLSYGVIRGPLGLHSYWVILETAYD